MFAFARRPALLRTLATTALTALATACYTWQTTTTPTPESLSKKKDAKFRITSIGGGVLNITGVHLRNDSVLGYTSATTLGKPPREVGLPTSEIARIQSSEINGPLTIGAIAILGVATAAVIASATEKTPPPRRTTTWCSASDPNCTFSCPLIYSWDGDSYWLDSGTFGGAITPALTRTDLDNLVRARPTQGVLRFLLTDEANETEHVDAFAVLAVDHPVGTTVAPDARANGTFHVVGPTSAALSARDLMNREVLAQIGQPDGRVWESRLDGRDPANPAHLRDGLELTFARPVGTDRAQLVIDAQNTEWASALMGQMVSAFGRLTSSWYDPGTTAAASEPMRRAQREEGFLAVTVWDGSAWREAGEVWEAGPEVAKRQVLPVDLTGIPGDRIRVRLESAPAFWDIDYVGLGAAVDAEVTTHTLATTRAASPRQPDALQRLAANDGRMLDMEYGDTVRIEVRDTAPPVRGMTRSYLARTSGWYRIHGRDNADPDIAMLTALAQQPHGAARIAISQLNDMLTLLNQQASHANRQ
jgi:hypothetical protein